MADRGPQFLIGSWSKVALTSLLGGLYYHSHLLPQRLQEREILDKTVILCNIVVCMYNIWASPVAQTEKRQPAVQETWVQSLGYEDPLEKEMAIYFSILAGEFHG